MTEAEFQANVIDLAKTLGWLVHHDGGDVRQTTYGDPGFPDLVLAKGGRVIFLELKSEKGKVTPTQEAWKEALPGFWIARPADIEKLAKLLGPR